MKSVPRDTSDKEIKISYTIKSSRRARGVRISVHADGRVVVTKPVLASRMRVEFFIQKKMAWIREKLAEFQRKPQKILAHYSVRDYKENKQKALEVVTERVRYWNQFYKHDINNILIKNQKTRWGSCSGKGNLSFNYKVLFLPEELQDYIIVHELCHLKEMNHGRRFWALVAEKIPDYKLRQKKIRLY